MRKAKRNEAFLKNYELLCAKASHILANQPQQQQQRMMKLLPSSRHQIKLNIRIIYGSNTGYIFSSLLTQNQT